MQYLKDVMPQKTLKDLSFPGAHAFYPNCQKKKKNQRPSCKSQKVSKTEPFKSIPSSVRTQNHVATLQTVRQPNSNTTTVTT